MSDPKTKSGTEPTLFKLNELDPSRGRRKRERAPGAHNGISDFHALFVDGKVVDPRKQAADQAKAITEKAQAELQDAKSRVEAIKKEAYEQGYEQGVAEGKAAASAQIMAACDNLGRTVEALERLKTQVLAGMEDEIIALVQAVVDRILLMEGAVHPELVCQVARFCVRKLSESDALTLTLNPADLDVVEEFAPQIKQGLGALKLLHLVTDASVHPGDCRVNTAEAQVEGGLETRRQRIFEVLDDLTQRSEGLDLETLLAKTPPGVEAMRQEASQGKPTVTPDDFGSPGLPGVGAGGDDWEDLEDLSASASQTRKPPSR